jgi:hypothetical protein
MRPVLMGLILAHTRPAIEQAGVGKVLSLSLHTRQPRFHCSNYER